MDEKPNTTPVDPPHGFYPARVDEKGRLKLPSAFQQYLKDLGEVKVFVTTLDVSTVRIYPTSVWKANLKFLEELASEDPEKAENVAFLANHFGADSEIDTQGRILVPQELRRKLNLENQPVWLQAYKGRISGYGKAQYEERMARAMADPVGNVRALEAKGLR